MEKKHCGIFFILAIACIVTAAAHAASIVNGNFENEWNGWEGESADFSPSSRSGTIEPEFQLTASPLSSGQAAEIETDGPSDHYPMNYLFQDNLGLSRNPGSLSFLNFTWRFYDIDFLTNGSTTNDDYFQVYFRDASNNTYGADGNPGLLIDDGGYSLGETAQIDITGLVNNNPLGLSLGDLSLEFAVMPGYVTLYTPSYLVLDNIAFSTVSAPATPVPISGTLSMVILALLLLVLIWASFAKGKRLTGFPHE
ncbi:MAG: hypothetical protein AB1611_06330 [bacterium]